MAKDVDQKLYDVRPAGGETLGPKTFVLEQELKMRPREMHALSGAAESGEEHIVAGLNLKLKNLKHRFYAKKIEGREPWI
jgi:hypothetical protein